MKMVETLCRNWAGTTGRKVPVDVSQVSGLAEPGREMSISYNEVDVAFSFDSSGSWQHAIAICSKSMAGVGNYETACTRGKASAA